ncbi:MAG: DUF262 domain-containing HNH endonuclease family protein [Carboxylicivirga sp.]|jgi:uncharacterized protein with ParB-like and HNH nuclease domain|nr:DUF262 domain-containing HNH endonuclease family protein [Carboxylicivirga sp.]
MSNNEDIKELTIADLFKTDRYIIPRYQRNYAWEEKEITQLIQDIFDFALNKDKSEANYYIGTLVVYERSHNGHSYYETIDGQQRLTTLNLLISALKRNFAHISEVNDFSFNSNLRFDSRIKSTTTLEAIADIGTGNEVKHQDGIDYNPNIKQGFSDAVKYMKKKLTNDSDTLQFFNYLTKNVKVFRVKVPHDTNLNHYFEIMNNRGEQLEKHEILKANMLDAIKGSDALKYTFNLIWEACSDMERYVQYGFSTSKGNNKINERELVFGSNWDSIQSENLQDIAQRLYSSDDDKNKDEDALSINDIINPAQKVKDTNGNTSREAERFTSVVSFPNFLLHVLRILKFNEEDIPLDDKRLLDTFKRYVERGADFVIEFGYALLKSRYLFDKYIIKRELLNEKEQWSLKRIKLYENNKVSYVNTFGDEESENGKNKELVMRLAMFHVSAPTQIYKHWLNAALYYLFNNEEQGYKHYLNNLSKAFLLDRYLSVEPLDFYDIIYKNKGVPKNSYNEARWDTLNRGTQVENFIFNYLDFELWKNPKFTDTSFEFAFRSSVEHYYPQNPVANIERMEKKVCDNFGNLCLLSSHKNSKLTNHTPEAKKDYYINTGIDSLKQKVMMDYKGDWNQKAIENHAEEMIDILKGNHNEQGNRS